MRLQRILRKLVVLNGMIIAGALVITVLVGLMPVPASGEVGATQPEGVLRWGFMAAAIAVGLGAIGAGIAVGLVGAAAMGTIGERPEMMGRTLIYVGLAEGIAIYGLIVAIMIFGRL